MNFLKSVKDEKTGKSLGRILIVILLSLGLILVTLGGEKNIDESASVQESEEDRLAELCSSLSGVGRCRVFIAYEEKPISYSSRTERVIVGVAVVCDGGGSDSVKSKITSLVDGLYGIGTNRIKVYEMQK